MQLQVALKTDMAETRVLADDTLKKLRLIGAETHQEWMEMRSSVETSITDFQSVSKSVLDETLSSMTRYKMALEKSIKTASEQEKTLSERLREVDRVLRTLDKSVPVEQILKDIQSEKYGEARELLNRGMDAPLISRKLGLSLNEVALISHMR